MGEVLLIAGVGAAEGVVPLRSTATVPDEERAITVRSGDVEEQSVLLQIVNTGLTGEFALSVAITCPR